MRLWSSSKFRRQIEYRYLLFNIIQVKACILRSVGFHFWTASPALMLKRLYLSGTAVFLQYEADKSGAAVVDDALESFLQFQTSLDGHFVELVVKSLVYEIVQ